MELFIDEEYEPLRELVRDFAEREIAPGAGTRDETEEHDEELFHRMADIGLTGILAPEEYGGSGMDLVANCIVIEEISKACAATGADISIHTALASWVLCNYGTEEQKKIWLTALAEGKYLGSFALTEPEAGSDIAGIKTTAIKDGDEYVLNGTKVFTSNAGPAGVYIVFAKTNPSERETGMSTFLVEKGTPGFTIGKPIKKLGIRAHTVAGLQFNNCRVKVENRIGAEGAGYLIASTALQSGRLGMSAQAIGLAQAAFSAAKEYVTQRRQFGTPLSEFQSMRFKFSEMATRIEAARLMVYQAAWLAKNGKPFAEASSMAKILASTTATYVTSEALQIFGGNGFTRDYPVERMMRDAKITQIYTGTVEMQHVLISDQIFV